MACFICRKDAIKIRDLSKNFARFIGNLFTKGFENATKARRRGEVKHGVTIHYQSVCVSTFMFALQRARPAKIENRDENSTLQNLSVFSSIEENNAQSGASSKYC